MVFVRKKEIPDACRFLFYRNRDVRRRTSADTQKEERVKIDSSYVGMSSVTKKTSLTARTAKRFVITDQSGKGHFSQIFDGKGNKNRQGIGYQQSDDSLMFLQERYRSTAGIRRISERQSDNALQTFKEECMQYIYYLLFERRQEHLSYQPGPTVTAQYGQIQYYHSEEENVAFQTQGTVRTADGREITFRLDVEMTQRFEEYYEENYGLSAVQMCDPLVINFSGNTAELSDVKLQFDLDADGEMDTISALQNGSGYLAVDKNGDGMINDGSELFGTENGDGFADLARYDEDGNGWIDENDSIWSKLLIWCRDGSGKQELYHIADKGVGAICLQKAATDYTIRGNDNQVNGAVRSTGIFLYENGEVGTIQHLDVAK